LSVCSSCGRVRLPVASSARTRSAVELGDSCWLPDARDIRFSFAAPRAPCSQHVRPSRPDPGYRCTLHLCRPTTCSAADRHVRPCLGAATLPAAGLGAAAAASHLLAPSPRRARPQRRSRAAPQLLVQARTVRGHELEQQVAGPGACVGLGFALAGSGSRPECPACSSSAPAASQARKHIGSSEQRQFARASRPSYLHITKKRAVPPSSWAWRRNPHRPSP
jgi:hypothetical protein